MSKPVSRPQIGKQQQPPGQLKVNVAGLENLPKVGATTGLVGPSSVSPKHLSEMEQAGLQLIGHDPSKPVPKEVLEKLPTLIEQAKAQQSVVEQQIERLKKNPIVQPAAVNIDDLSGAEQQQAIEAMQAMLGKRNELESIQKKLQSRPAMGARQTQTAMPPSVRPALDFEVEPLPGAAPPEPPPTPQVESDAGGIDPPVKVCPRCGWDCRNADFVEVTERDKIDFLTSVLAFPAKPFVKRYQLLGGHLTIDLAELRADQSDAVFKAVVRQAEEDNKTGLTILLARYQQIAAKYRSVVSVVRLETSKEVVDLTGVYDEAVSSGMSLEQYVDRVVTDYLATDTMTSVLQQTFGRFYDLCDKLRSMTASPDFWPAIR